MPARAGGRNATFTTFKNQTEAVYSFVLSAPLAAGTHFIRILKATEVRLLARPDVSAASASVLLISEEDRVHAVDHIALDYISVWR